MALQVWLPLINDIKNKGVADVEFTQYGTITAEPNEGKIGSCYSVIRSADGETGSLAYHGFSLPATGWSMCLWVKFTAFPASSTNSYIVCLNTSSASNCQAVLGVYYKSATTAYFTFNLYASGRIVSGLTLDRWYHLCITYDGTYGYMYVDGVLKNTVTSPNIQTTAAQNLVINGRSDNTAGTTFTGRNCSYYMNDVRVYDHCLSAKEVREIAQGLICHYKLDNGGCGNPNLIMPLYYQSSPWKTAIKEWVYYEGKRTMIVSANTLYSNTSAGTTSLFPEITFKENTQYTISVDWRDDYRTDGKNTSLYLRFKYTDGSTATQIISPATSKTEWTHSKLTSSSGKTVSMVSTTYGNGGYTYVANLKIEEGATETAFEPFGVLNADDSSGYGNHGTVVGNVPVFTNTPRHSGSFSFSSGSYIKKTGLVYDSNVWTTTLWYYKPTNPTAYEALFCLSKGNGSDANKKIAACLNNGYIWYKTESGSRSIYKLKVAEWTFLAISCDGTTAMVYENDVQIGTISAGTAMTGCTDLVLGARASSSGAETVSVPYTGMLSDFRIYATALSADDIKELYEVSMSISSYGDVLPYELLEDDEVSGLTKAGVLQSSAYLGNGDWMPYDQTIYTEPDGSQWVKIVHHNNPASKLFGSGNTFATTVYIDEDRWFNASLCDSVNQWEFMVKEAVAANGTELKYRWIQDANPMTAVYADVGSAKITKYTSEDGYNNFPSNWGGIYKKNSNTFLSQNNGTASSWWGAIGSWTAYQGGIPGFGNNNASTHIIKTGYLDLYLRIDNLTFCETDSVARTYKNTAWSARQFIER